MTTESTDSNVTSILERRDPGARFTPVAADPVVFEPDLALLPDMSNMNARRVVETIASALAGH